MDGDEYSSETATPEEARSTRIARARVLGLVVEFLGEEFILSDRIGLMPLMRFARLAKNGADTDEMEGLVALYDLLRQCVHDDEWARFESHCDRTRATDNDLMGFVQQAVGVLTARPSRRPSGSSDGPPTTNMTSPGDSSEEAIALLESRGRPDLAYVVEQARRSKASV